jgi:hypothetical protein
MNSQLDRPPTQAQRWLGVGLSIVALVGSGVLAAALWAAAGASAGTMVVAAFFSVLCLASAFVLHQALRTAPSAPSAGQLAAVAWFLLLAGACCLALAFASGVSSQGRVTLLACGTSCLAYGIAGIIKRPRI